MSYFQKSLVEKTIQSLRKPLTFIYKDFISESSYKFSFLSQFVGIFITALAWFFLSNLFGGTVSEHLIRYEGNYFSFVIIGIAFANYLQVALRSFSSNIRNAQTLGTLEAMLVMHSHLHEKSLTNYLQKKYM
jgi:ABC-2 type transport system permease protein